MPRVPLIATKDFGYNTRRLKANDKFEARNAVEALILTRVRKVAEAPKAKKAAPILTTHEVLTAEVVEPAVKAAPAKPAATRKAPAKRKAKAKS